ncbi:MAG: protein kinase [Chloroflexi bacterium]|nr:protein kinase [Chloroflexota bacterium]
MENSEPSPQTIRGYELGGLIGKGGFGSVYRAHQPIINRDVAIKIILPAYANDPQFIRQFELEAHVVARLEHPHIVPLYDYWREPDRAYLIMRLLRGGNLRKLILMNPKGLPLNAIAGLLDQISSALQFAHTHEVIHQDIKPENILLDEQGNAYLSDFGIAKSLVETNPEKVKYIFGSPEYMSPEAVMQKTTSALSDIYSLGIMLYELLTGVLPFIGKSREEFIQGQLYGNVPPVSLQRLDIPEQMNEVIWQATAKVAAERFTSTAELSEAFYRAADIVKKSLVPIALVGEAAAQNLVESQQLGTMVFEKDVASARNPYKGLRAFEEIDAADFFGREALVSKILGRLEHERFLAVVGPSGSGKSSVIRAGVLPILRNGANPTFRNNFFLTMTPGANPVQELESSLLQIAVQAENIQFDRTCLDSLKKIGQKIFEQHQSGIVIFIDQFEEVFTSVEDEAERNYFLENIVQAVQDPQSHFHILVTLRADLYDRPLLYANFGELVRAHTEVVLPLAPKELEYAIIGPAQRAGATFESILLAAIIADVIRQPGALPLLQYTLTELFENRHSLTLTLETYNRLGGLSGTLTRRADELYSTLDPAEKTLVRMIFLQIISIVEGSEPVRRRISQTDLLAEQSPERKEAIQKVLELFYKQRFLTFDRDPVTRTPTVEIAHEALIREWGRLKEWIEASRDEVRIQRQLANSTQDWLKTDRDTGFLARGARLDQFKSLYTSTHQTISLSSDEKTYLTASIALHNRLIWYRRLIAGVLTTLTIIAIILAGLALDRANQADQQRNRANNQAHVAQSRELAASALANDDQIDLALLLSLEALRASDTFEARNSLLDTLRIEPRLEAYLHGHTDLVRSVAFSPDGRSIASGGRDNQIIVWDAQNHTKRYVLTGHEDWINSVAFSPDGTVLASGSADNTVRLWDVASGQMLDQPLEASIGAVWSVRFSPDGQFLAAGGEDGLIQIWDVKTHLPLGPPLAGHTDIVYSVAFSPDSQMLASGSADSTVRLWDVATGKAIGEPLMGHTNWVLAVAFHPSGSLLASAGADQNIMLWRLDTKNPANNMPVFTIEAAHTDWIRSLAFDPSGDVLASASADQSVKFWSVASGQPTSTPIQISQNEVWSVGFSPQGDEVVSTDGNAVVLLRVQANQLQTNLLINDLAVDPNKHLLAGASGGPTEDDGLDAVTLWDVTDHQFVAQLTEHTGPVTSVAFSPDGVWLASAGADQTIILWDAASYQLKQRLVTSTLAQNPVWSVVFSPDSRLLASANEAGQVTLWDVATGEPSGKPLVGHTAGVVTLAFSPDGRILATAGHDHTIRLWNMQDRTLMTVLEGHTDSVLALAFSPDGRYLASGSRDKTILLWTLASDSAEILLGHTSWVTDLVFTADGQQLVSSGRDGRVIWWDVSSRSMLGRPYLQENLWLTSLVLDGVSDSVISASRRGDLLFWETGMTRWRAKACQIANRDLTDEEQLKYLGHLVAPMCPQ